MPLRTASMAIHQLSDSCKKAYIATGKSDERLNRAQLMLEEMAELLEAMLLRDPIQMADALADVLYVVYGTAVTYAVPVDEVFQEVHASNMTKRVVDHAAGIKGKGESYRAPDIAAVLRRAGKPS